MGGAPKAFLPLLDQPLVAYPLQALEETPEVDAVVLVLPVASVEQGRALVKALGLRKVYAVCAGGATRRDSVYAGLLAAPPSQWTLVHDGARPCAMPELFSKGLAAVQATGAVLAAVPVQDTIKEVGPGGVVMRTPERSRLYAAQTPQVFATASLREAHEQAPPDLLLDDASLMEAMGLPVHIYPGDPSNIKVTTPADLVLAEAILRQRRLSYSPSLKGEGG
jgi:2-C-methyl-D-erythritol 4-phosphate cytidylyltransferase